MNKIALGSLIQGNTEKKLLDTGVRPAQYIDVQGTGK
jgi:hypothetical protein